MAKLDMGIIAILGLGVGAFVLSKTGKKDDDLPQITPTIVTPLQPTAIIPTDKEITIGTGQTGVFAGIETPVLLPTQIESTTTVSTPIPKETTEQVIEAVFGGELDERQKEAIVKQATKINASFDMLFSGQINVDEEIKFRAITNTGVGVLTYSWTFEPDKFKVGTDKQFVTHRFSKEGQYKVILFVSSSLGASARVTKTINVIPIPLTTGMVTMKILPQTNGAIIRLTNNHKKAINGRININMSGANKSTKSQSRTINGKTTVDQVVFGLNAGSTTFSVSYRPKGSSRNLILDNVQTINITTTQIPTPNVVKRVDSPITIARKILSGSIKAPTWVKNNARWFLNKKISSATFQTSINFLKSNGFM
jgi:hypothetical protein